MPAKKPLTFQLDAASPAQQQTPATQAARPPNPVQAATEDGRKQVGARIPASLYRRLKAEAALSGQPVQIHVEAAIEEYLDRRKK